MIMNAVELILRHLRHFKESTKQLTVSIWGRIEHDSFFDEESKHPHIVKCKFCYNTKTVLKYC